MVRYPSMHTNYLPVRPLTEQLYTRLLEIYKMSTTYVCRFYVPGFENSEIVWPETATEHQWIIDNILPFYGVKREEIVNLVYKDDDYDSTQIQRVDSNRRDWGFDKVPPWTPNTLNFTRCTEDSIIGSHNDHEAGCKINIPILNMSAANLYFNASDERYYYPAPALLNVREQHEVENLSRLRQFNIPERTFFQIVFKGEFKHYTNMLPLPFGY